MIDRINPIIAAEKEIEFLTTDVDLLVTRYNSTTAITGNREHLNPVIYPTVKSNYQYFHELAPLYALDLLDLEERLWVNAQLGDCPDLAQELANYQIAVGLMSYSAPTVPMSDDLKDRLFDRLNLDSVPMPLPT
jgi:hypothetical protein